MRTRGSSTFAIATLLLASTALAAEIWTEPVPAGSTSYVVTAVLLPGCTGGEVLGGDKGFDHIDFRIGFEPGGNLIVNGVDAGVFDPHAVHTVTVTCVKIGPCWFASTKIVNEQGSQVFEQVNYRMPGAVEQVRASGEDVLDLNVQ